MLTKISTPGQSDVEFIYDAMNNRVARKVGSDTTRYVLDLNSEMSQVLAETDGMGFTKLITYMVTD